MLDAIAEEDRKLRITTLVSESDRRQFDDPCFRRELQLWARSRRPGTGDEKSGADFGMPDVLSAVGRLVIRIFDIGSGIPW